jgi:hypothetical protein
MSSTLVMVVVLVAAAAFIVLDLLRRMPRGGDGPRIAHVPRRLRPATNRIWKRRGWPQPFDEEGHRLPPG